MRRLLRATFGSRTLLVLLSAGLSGACGGALAPTRPTSSRMDATSSPERAAQARRIVREPRLVDRVRPDATRQTDEGYWLGALLRPEHIAWLTDMGIRVVISAVRLDDKTIMALERVGIRHVSVPMGSSFRDPERILEAVAPVAPQQVFVHCRHGADRTGAIAAFLLVTRHGWSIPDAFYSVLYPSQLDAAGLAEALARHGIFDARQWDDPSVGFYSVSAAGGVGGLKARNARYQRLVETTVEAVIALTPIEPIEATAWNLR